MVRIRLFSGVGTMDEFPRIAHAETPLKPGSIFLQQIRWIPQESFFRIWITNPPQRFQVFGLNMSATRFIHRTYVVNKH